VKTTAADRRSKSTKKPGGAGEKGIEGATTTGLTRHDLEKALQPIVQELKELRQELGQNRDASVSKTSMKDLEKALQPMVQELAGVRQDVHRLDENVTLMKRQYATHMLAESRVQQNEAKRQVELAKAGLVNAKASLAVRNELQTHLEEDLSDVLAERGGDENGGNGD
jgi:RNA-splicing ligase RtcB